MLNILNWTSILEDSCFCSSLPVEVVTIAILKYALFQSLRCCMNRKLKTSMFLPEKCAVLKVTTSVWSAVFWPWHRPTIVLLLVAIDNSLVLLIISCSKSTQKYAARGCQIATVVMATTQLVLSQFQKFLSCQLRIE